MRRLLIVAAAFFVLFLFAGGMLAILGAQSREVGGAQVPMAQAGRTAVLPAAIGAVGLGAPAAGGTFDLNQVLETPTGLLYALSHERGFLVSLDRGRSWIERNEGLPRRVVYPFTGQGRVRLLTSLNVDPLREIYQRTLEKLLG